MVSSPGATLYLTVFVSHHVNLHLGKTEGERGPGGSGTKRGGCVCGGRGLRRAGKSNEARYCALP